MRRLLILFATSLFTSACYDSSFGEPAPDMTEEPVTTSIEELRKAYKGTTFRVDSEVIVTGRVTTSDRRGNFYRTFCIEEQGAAMEVMAGIDYLHNDFPTGCCVTLRLRGFALGMNLGVLQVGRMPTAGSGFTTDYIGSKAALDKAITRIEEVVEPLTPLLSTITSLTPQLCGRLVRIEGLRYTPETEPTTQANHYRTQLSAAQRATEELLPTTWAGYRRFTDDNGSTIHTFVRTYADFANEQLPTERITLTGILQYDATNEGRYIIKIRDENDCTE